MSLEAAPKRRGACPRCRRPAPVCYCSRISLLPTRTRILLLQHARERHIGIGTARMAHLGLPSSTLRVGVDFADDPDVAAALADPAPAYVLFPGPTARDIAEIPRGGPMTLVVLDGTWSQARKLLRLNPRLRALPRVAFVPRQESAYRIRRQPAAFCLSTIEALAEVLQALEPESGPFDRLLDPFRAMVEWQERFAREIRQRRHAPAASFRAGKRRPPPLPARLADAWPNIVCVQGEANAWSKGHPDAGQPEVVHWVAHRPATGATYEAVIAPRAALAPSTAAFTDLAAARLTGGISLADWRQSWSAFARPDDLLVHWGTFHTALAAAEGLPLPEAALDLRTASTRYLRARVGTIEQCAARLGTGAGAPTSLGLDGRGGRRLAALVDLVVSLASRQGGERVAGAGPKGAW